MFPQPIHRLDPTGLSLDAITGAEADLLPGGNRENVPRLAFEAGLKQPDRQSVTQKQGPRAKSGTLAAHKPAHLNSGLT